MAYKVIKWRKGHPYLYEQDTYRKDGVVKTNSRYIGRCDESGNVLHKQQKSNNNNATSKPKMVATTHLIDTTPNGHNDKVNNAILSILDKFESGDIPEAIALVVNPSVNYPSMKWSLMNRLILWVNETHDARGYRQWQEIGRHVKQGSKAISIFAPRIKTITKTNTDGEDETKLIVTGFRGVPVFRYEDTEGDPLEYENIPQPELPLREVAEQWDINISLLPGNITDYYGCYIPGESKIELASPEECVFFHELSHVAHGKIEAIKCGQDWRQEVIAELAASVLCFLVGKKPVNLGQHFKYIKMNALENSIDPVKACYEVIGTVDKVINLILETSKNVSRDNTTN